MKKLKKLLTLVLAGVLAFSAFAGCSNTNGTAATETAATETAAAAEATEAPAETAETTDASGSDDTLVVVGSMNPVTMDPYGSSLNNKTVLHQIFDTLTVFDENGELAPCLAESWEESEDGHYFTYHLRNDVVFHDGSPFNADCVVYSVDRMLSSDGMGWASVYVEKVEKVDDYTVNVYKATAFSALNNFMNEYLYIISPTAYEANDPAYNPVGTGAYKFVKWGDDDYIYLTANEDYFMGTPGFTNLVIRPVLDASTTVVALQNDEVDIAISLPLSQRDLVESDENLATAISDGWSEQTIVMMGEDYMNDQNLRKAIYYAVNRDNAALFNSMPEDYVPATNILATRLMGDHAGFMDIGGYDPDKAAEYLAQSDYDGRTLPIIALDTDVNIAQSVQADLEAIGITSEIKQVDSASYSNMYVTGASGLYFGDWGCDYASCEDQLSYHAGFGFYGAYLYNDEEFDSCLEQAGEIYVEADRSELVERALYLAWDFANMVPLYESLFMYAYQADLTGLETIWAANFCFYFYKVQPAA